MPLYPNLPSVRGSFFAIKSWLPIPGPILEQQNWENELQSLVVLSKVKPQKPFSQSKSFERALFKWVKSNEVRNVNVFFKKMQNSIQI